MEKEELIRKSLIDIGYHCIKKMVHERLESNDPPPIRNKPNFQKQDVRHMDN
jgi:hypothetical protein